MWQETFQLERNGSSVLQISTTLLLSTGRQTYLDTLHDLKKNWEKSLDSSWFWESWEKPLESSFYNPTLLSKCLGLERTWTLPLVVFIAVLIKRHIWLETSACPSRPHICKWPLMAIIDRSISSYRWVHRQTHERSQRGNVPQTWWPRPALSWPCRTGVAGTWSGGAPRTRSPRPRRFGPQACQIKRKVLTSGIRAWGHQSTSIIWQRPHSNSAS